MNNDKVIIDSQKAYLMPKLKTSTFATINASVLGSEPFRLGPGRTAVSTMLSSGDELRVLMPVILGLDPKSVTNNWDTKVSDYWYSLSVEVKPEGNELEIGFKYSIDDTTTFFDGTKRSGYISKLIKDNPTIKTSADLMEYVKGKDAKGNPNVAENEKYKYAMPISVEDYILWRYCLVFREVANNLEDVDKSSFIRFYLYNSAQAESDKRAKFKLEKTAMELYQKVIADKEFVENVLHTLQLDTTGKDEIDKCMLLESVYKDSPEKFIKIASDNQLKSKAAIERYILAGILKRLPNTDVIVDANEPDKVLGNTLIDAVSYINNEKNKVQVSQYLARIKGLNKA